MENKKTGTVKFFNDTKGFGFIVEDDKSPNTNGEIFVHVTGLSGGSKVTQGDKVEYEVIDGRKGLNAVNVRKIG